MVADTSTTWRGAGDVLVRLGLDHVDRSIRARIFSNFASTQDSEEHTLALVWILPLLAVPLFAYSLLPFWTK